MQQVSDKRLFSLQQKVGCDSVIGSNAVIDRCGVCNGDGSTCLPGSRESVTRNSTSTKKAVTPGAANLITSALEWLKHMGYDVDRRGQIASPESTTKDTQKDDFYWAVVKSGCSVSCGGGSGCGGLNVFKIYFFLLTLHSFLHERRLYCFLLHECPYYFFPAVRLGSIVR